MRQAIRDRIKDVSMVRGLTAAEIKMAMTTKAFELEMFSKKYNRQRLAAHASG
jgi:hypothetical protein